MGRYLRLALVLALAGVGYYDRRDLFMHWIRRDQQERRPCTHACCRGMRAHPERYPVTRRNAYLRHASDQELAGYYGRHGDDTPADQRVRDQILGEMQRRDIRQERREAAEERRRTRYAASRAERRAVIENEYVRAEAATNGYMLNQRGREAGVEPRTLFTGPENRARKYASEELLEYWESTPRPTQAMFEGRDTRIGYTGASLASLGVKRRITSEEQEWRDRYDQAAAEFEQVA